MVDAVGENQGPQTRQLAVEVDGIHTDVLSTWFSDRVMVVVTPYNKFGTLPVWHVYGQQIASVIGENDESNRQVLAIALKRHSPGVLHLIMDQVRHLKTQPLVK